ncbi:MAG: hypothetical protein Q8914_08250 [Bacteroidota bacterium]|nr:hypothetical protein [Bacteroidota bacterium]
MENTLQEEKKLAMNQEVRNYLIETAKWGKFLAIAGYVMMAIVAVFGFLFMLNILPFGSNIPSNLAGAVGVAIGLLYLLFAVLYYFPITYLYHFSTRIKLGLQEVDETIVTDAFQQMKKLFKFIGIITIVILSIYALVLAIGLPLFLIAK